MMLILLGVFIKTCDPVRMGGAWFKMAFFFDMMCIVFILGRLLT